MPITEFMGVYDADSTLRGEVSYWIGARVGRAHCSLCDVTHGVFLKKKEWQQCVSGLSVPFITYHRNNAPDDVLAVANGQFPIVLARRNETLEIVLTDTELSAFHGSPQLLADHLRSLSTSSTE